MRVAKEKLQSLERDLAEVINRHGLDATCGMPE